MNHFVVNGIEQKFPIAMVDSFEKLLGYVRENLVTETSWVSSILINGDEMSESDESALSCRPLSEIGNVEIFTAHPREIAEETLQNALEFTNHLEAFIYQTAEAMDQGRAEVEFARLVDGISTFTESLQHAKRILRISALSVIDVLEADLVSILSDLGDYYERGDREYVKTLLVTYLSSNIRAWREQGIPAIIRSRDS